MELIKSPIGKALVHCGIAGLASDVASESWLMGSGRLQPKHSQLTPTHSVESLIHALIGLPEIGINFS